MCLSSQFGSCHRTTCKKNDAICHSKVVKGSHVHNILCNFQQGNSIHAGGTRHIWTNKYCKFAWFLSKISRFTPKATEMAETMADEEKLSYTKAYVAEMLCLCQSRWQQLQLMRQFHFSFFNKCICGNPIPLGDEWLVKFWSNSLFYQKKALLNFRLNWKHQ